METLNDSEKSEHTYTTIGSVFKELIVGVVISFPKRETPYMPNSLLELLQKFFEKIEQSRLTVYEVAELIEFSPATVYEWRKALAPHLWKVLRGVATP